MSTMKITKTFRPMLCTALGVMAVLQVQAQSAEPVTQKPSEEDSVIAVYNTKKTDPATIDFHFVYIDHEPQPATPATQLCTRINKLRTNAAETGNALIVYLANEDTPLLSFTNVADPDGAQQRDSLEAFYEIIDASQSVPSHEVNSVSDVDSIKKLIGPSGAFPLFDEASGEMRYKSVTIDFYVGPRFWNLRHNDNIIAQLYVILRLKDLMKKYQRKQLSFNVYKAQGQVLNYPEGKPFGLHNKDGINDNPKVNTIKEY